MARLKLSDLGLRPSVKTQFRLGPQRLDIPRGIIGPHADLDRVLHQGPQCFEQPVSALWLIGAGGHELDDVLTLQRRGALVAVFSAETINDVATDGLLFHAAKFKRLKVTYRQRAH